ncbi:hypothetical protein [Segetibacter aerophilus]|uniref:Lipoprotein n=1 Tax=Segetibacter aerophilus TaxID=670293 RepID=A0A512BGL8_9BACT|nr:hypothetical protein [Segetibacter aerophilus]GEO11112.1 hypothetical protein SAE01_36080 [Segetibacter aerophilus]
MTTRYLIIFFLLVASCNSGRDTNSLGKPTSFEAPELSVACSKVIKTLRNEFHGVAIISTAGNIEKDSLISHLNRLKSYGVVENSGFETFVKRCNNLRFVTWKSNNREQIITRIEKVTYKTDVSGNTIKVTDFDVYSTNKPNHFALRIINDYQFEYLILDHEKYTRVSESVLVGVDEAMAGLDATRNACK